MVVEIGVHPPPVVVSVRVTIPVSVAPAVYVAAEGLEALLHVPVPPLQVPPVADPPIEPPIA